MRKPEIIKTKASFGKPLGFQASLSNCSLGPTVSLPDKAPATADMSAAAALLRLIPPLPKRNKIPRMRDIMPSTSNGSVGETLLFAEKSLMLTK
jgi:hypothetical protein